MQLKDIFYDSAEVKKAFIDQNYEKLEEAISLIKATLDRGNKILICGNGGSAADSQHIAAEIIGRFEKEKTPLPAIALTTDSSIITAIGNDYGFINIFKKQVEGLGKKGDLLLALSTSGNSENIILAINVAKKREMKTIALLGKDGGKIKEIVDIALVVPSNNTARIQECHQTIYHAICKFIE